jgi:hypothetical protein
MNCQKLQFLLYSARSSVFSGWVAVLIAGLFLLGWQDPVTAQSPSPTPVYPPNIPCAEFPLLLPAGVCSRALPEKVRGVQLLPTNSDAIHLPYAHIYPDTKVYGSPENGMLDIHVKRLLGNEHGRGLVYVTTEDYVEIDGQGWYKINGGEWVAANRLTFIKTSPFAGIRFLTPPQDPVGWVVATVRPSASAGGEPDPAAPLLRRYQVVKVLEKQLVGYWEWYRVGPDLWVEQRNMAVAWQEEKPAKDIKEDRWISIDIYEQVLTAYEDDRMVFATLISSGLQQFATQPGLYRIYAQVEFDNMSGAYTATKSDFYYIEDVPWTMYFDGDRAIHAAYWHDGFGFRKSHGCVNLSPSDAYWLYTWASKGTWVWVHNPFPE